MTKEEIIKAIRDADREWIPEIFAHIVDKIYDEDLEKEAVEASDALNEDALDSISNEMS